MNLPDPSELQGEARRTFELWQHMGLSENAAMLEVVRAGHVPVDEAEMETARLEKSLRAWGVNESIARTAARINPASGRDYSGTLAEFGLRESDPLSEFRDGTPSVRESASSTGAEALRQAVGEATRKFATSLNLSEANARDLAIAEAKQYALRFNTSPADTASYLKTMTEATVKHVAKVEGK